MSGNLENIREDKTVSKSEKIELQVLSFGSPAEFEGWLEQNNHLVTGIWIRFYKKGSGIQTIVYKEALDVALCYGWIDGQLKKFNDNSYIQKFTPRRPKSLWSKRNIDHVARLEKEGKMKPPGIIAVEVAKKDGRWERAYDSPGDMNVPDEFLELLSKRKNALEFYESLNKTNKYSIGWRLQTAKNAETRQKRIVQIVEMMERKEKFH